MPFPLIPVLFGVAAGGVIAELFDLGRGLFGIGDPVAAPPPPPPPLLPSGTNNPAEQDRNDQNTKDNNDIGEDANNGNHTQEGAEQNSAEGRDKLDQILEQLNQIAGRNNSPEGGATPETQAATDQAVRDGLRELRDTVTGADAANRGLAGQPPGMGGMNPLGGLGGVPGMGGMNPLSSLGGTPGMAPAVNPLAMDPGPTGPTPEPVNPLTDAGNDSDPGPGPVSNPLTDTGSADTPGSDDPANPHDPPTHPASTPDTPAPPQPDNTAAKEVTAPDGQKITAPDETAAAALRAALENPGATNQAAAAYQAAGVTLPADGSDPGELVSAGEIRPGDIARWDDPPRDLLVFGNGKVIDTTGKLADLNTMLSSGVFNAFFRPKIDSSAATQPTTHQPAAEPSPAPADATP